MKRTQAHAAFAKVSNLRPLPSWRAEGPGKPFSVETQKSSGRWIVFSRYASQAEAHQVAARLQAIGAPCRVVGSDVEQ